MKNAKIDDYSFKLFRMSHNGDFKGILYNNIMHVIVVKYVMFTINVGSLLICDSKTVQSRLSFNKHR